MDLCYQRFIVAVKTDLDMALITRECNVYYSFIKYRKSIKLQGFQLKTPVNLVFPEVPLEGAFNYIEISGYLGIFIRKQ